MQSYREHLPSTVHQLVFIATLGAVLTLLTLGFITDITQARLEITSPQLSSFVFKKAAILLTACASALVFFVAGRRGWLLQSVFHPGYAHSKTSGYLATTWHKLRSLVEPILPVASRGISDPGRSILAAAWILFAVNALLQAITLLFGIERGGSKRWLNLGFMEIQTSEFGRLLVILSWGLLASVYIRHRSRRDGIRQLWALLFMTLVLMVCVAWLQSAMSALMINLTLCGALMFTVPGTRITNILPRWLRPHSFSQKTLGLTALVLLGAGFVYAVMQVPHVSKRFDGLFTLHQAGLTSVDDPREFCAGVEGQYRNFETRRQWVQAAKTRCDAHYASEIPMSQWTTRYSYVAETTDFVTATIMRNFGLWGIKITYLAWLVLITMLVAVLKRVYRYDYYLGESARSSLRQRACSMYRYLFQSAGKNTEPWLFKIGLVLVLGIAGFMVSAQWHIFVMLAGVAGLLYLLAAAIWYAGRLPDRLGDVAELPEASKRQTTRLVFACCYIMSALVLITVQITGHTIVNVFPIVTGIPLPLVSRGGSNLLVNCLLLGYTVGLCQFILDFATPARSISPQSII